MVNRAEWIQGEMKNGDRKCCGMDELETEGTVHFRICSRMSSWVNSWRMLNGWVACVEWVSGVQGENITGGERRRGVWSG